MAPIVRDTVMATEGNKVSAGFQKDEAVRCWRDAIEHSGLDDQQIADAAGISKGYFSKVSSGQQGDLLGLVCHVGRALPDLRRDFIARWALVEGADPLTAAAEQLARASIRFLQIRGAAIPFRMAHATVADRADRKVAR